MSEFIFRSGKHMGKTLALVEKIDPNYLAWVRENAPGMLKEYKARPKQAEPSPRKEVPEDGKEIKKSALSPNLDFLNQGPHGKLS